MKNVKRHIQSAYGVLSDIAVKGDAVEAVAFVRIELREALAALEQSEAAVGLEVSGDAAAEDEV